MYPLDTNGARKQKKNILIGHGAWKMILSLVLEAPAKKSLVLDKGWPVHTVLLPELLTTFSCPISAWPDASLPPSRAMVFRGLGRFLPLLLKSDAENSIASQT